LQLIVTYAVLKLFFSFVVSFVMSLVRRLSELIWGEEPLLSETQVKLIKSSWRKVERGDLQETGLIMFKR